MSLTPYRGRLAPSPTGHLHLGHARTFWIAQERARARHGTLVLRNENLDPQRCKPEFIAAMMEDLRWFGLEWEEGPDCGGPFAPYNQSERTGLYRASLEKLRAGGFIYPCTCSRKDVQRAAQAPHATDEEPIYPGTCRGKAEWRTTNADSGSIPGTRDRQCHWRFRVPDGEVVSFADGCQGLQSFVAGRNFGDFVVWRSDGVPAYQLAVVVDDALMRITEVVRGADLLLSTARQILLFRALGWEPPAFHHCPLLTDERGVRLAKRHEALSLRGLRARGATPQSLREAWQPMCTPES
jgi:glutamyl/glutaminyl-tRNA synthetase